MSARVWSIRHAVWKTREAEPATSQSTFEGTGTRFSAGTAASSEWTPRTCSPIMWNDGQSDSSPCRQNSHSPQETPALTATWSPGSNRVTPSDCLDDAGRVTAGNVGHLQVDSGHPATRPDVEVVQRARLNVDKDFAAVGLDPGNRRTRSRRGRRGRRTGRPSCPDPSAAPTKQYAKRLSLLVSGWAVVSDR